MSDDVWRYHFTNWELILVRGDADIPRIIKAWNRHGDKVLDTASRRVKVKSECVRLMYVRDYKALFGRKIYALARQECRKFFISCVLDGVCEDENVHILPVLEREKMDNVLVEQRRMMSLFV